MTGRVKKAVKGLVTAIDANNIFESLSDMDSSEVINSLGGPKSGNLEEKLDFLISLFVQQKKENDQHKEMIKNLCSKTATLEKENAALKREVRAAKESINRSELASRNLTLRVLGLLISSEESRAPPGESNKVGSGQGRLRQDSETHLDGCQEQGSDALYNY